MTSEGGKHVCMISVWLWIGCYGSTEELTSWNRIHQQDTSIRDRDVGMAVGSHARIEYDNAILKSILAKITIATTILHVQITRVNYKI